MHAYYVGKVIVCEYCLLPETLEYYDQVHYDGDAVYCAVCGKLVYDYGDPSTGE